LSKGYVMHGLFGTMGIALLGATHSVAMKGGYQVRVGWLLAF
jgi:hypothetical protein